MPHLILSYEEINWFKMISINLTENITDWIIANASTIIYDILTCITVENTPYLVAFAYHPLSYKHFLAIVDLSNGKIVNEIDSNLGFSLTGHHSIMDVNNDSKPEPILTDLETSEGILGTKYYTWLVALTIPNGELLFREKIGKEGDWIIANKINLVHKNLPYLVLINTENIFEPPELGIYSIEELKLIASTKIKKIEYWLITALAGNIDNDEIDELVIYSSFQGILAAYDINIKTVLHISQVP